MGHLGGQSHQTRPRPRGTSGGHPLSSCSWLRSVSWTPLLGGSRLVVQGWLATLLTPQSLSICFPPCPPPRRLGGRSSQAVTRMQTYGCPLLVELRAVGMSLTHTDCSVSGREGPGDGAAFQSRLSRTSNSERRHLGPQPQDSQRARVLEQGPCHVQGQGPGSQTVPQEIPRTRVGSLSHFSMMTVPALTKG